MPEMFPLDLHVEELIKPAGSHGKKYTFARLYNVATRNSLLLVKFGFINSSQQYQAPSFSRGQRPPVTSPDKQDGLSVFRYGDLHTGDRELGRLVREKEYGGGFTPGDTTFTGPISNGVELFKQIGQLAYTIPKEHQLWLRGEKEEERVEPDHVREKREREARAAEAARELEERLKAEELERKRRENVIVFANPDFGRF